MSTQSLELIRQEIDRIDDAIVALLGERAAATAQVRAQKSGDGSIAASPIRPAREAAILRRLMARRSAGLDPQTLVRLWRGILVSSTLAQAPVHLHIAASNIDERLALRDHFGPMPVVEHETIAAALGALEAKPGDNAALPAQSAWALAAGTGRQPTIIATLPILQQGAAPQIFIFGHAQAQPSGDDVTIIIGAPGTTTKPLWHLNAGGLAVFAVTGFTSDADLPSLALPGARIAGRCPAPIEV